MSYDISITRAPDGFSAKEYPISYEEWLAFVQAEPSLEISETDYTEWKTWGRIYDTVWLERPEPESGPTHLHWYDWAVLCSHADDVMIEKMIEIARKLGANVIGEEGEFYPEE